MAKQTLFKLRDIASDKNPTTEPGQEVENSLVEHDRWYTTEEVVREYRNYANNQERFKKVNNEGKYFLSIREIKVIDVCPHCGGDISEDGSI